MLGHSEVSTGRVVGGVFTCYFFFFCNIQIYILQNSNTSREIDNNAFEFLQYVFFNVKTIVELTSLQRLGI